MKCYVFAGDGFVGVAVRNLDWDIFFFTRHHADQLIPHAFEKVFRSDLDHMSLTFPAFEWFTVERPLVVELDEILLSNCSVGYLDVLSLTL